jgi:hypothetical protein
VIGHKKLWLLILFGIAFATNLPAQITQMVYEGQL